MEVHNALMFTSCPGASFATILAFSIGLALTDESGFLNVFVWDSFKGNSNFRLR